MKLSALVETSEVLRKTRSRKQKQAHLAQCLLAMQVDELPAGVAYLVATLPQGRIGLGFAAVKDARQAPVARDSTLTVAEVDAVFTDIERTSGAGSATRRRALLGGLFARSTSEERDFLGRLIHGELRQGASVGVFVAAVAQAAEVPVAAVRRAHMVSSDIAAVTAAALRGGVSALEEFRLSVFRPVLPMLAQPAEEIESALGTLASEASFELKLDGARVQVHKNDDEVRVYSRRLNEVTAAVPELVEAARLMPARSLILDGETIALKPGGRPHPFQVTMRRFGRRLDVAAMQAELPLSGFYFDCLLLDDQPLVDKPAGERWDALSAAVGFEFLVPRRVTADAGEAEAFWHEALAQGHEGLMAKSLHAPYEAGGRGKHWLKLKPAHTLDLVVLAVEWGSGRRQGWLSNLHLGARKEGGGFVMLGKTFKGMTDAMLTWQTEKLSSLEVSRDEWTVYVKPELVVEIAFNDVQESPHYPAGMALRFARVKRYREDKTVEQADTIDTVRSIFEASR